MIELSFGSVCSGIEAASVAWEPLGMRPVWFAEVDKAASALLEYRFPQIPNLGDMTGIPALLTTGVVDAPDVLVGGTPCQAFSVAGRREGLADARGQLTLSYVEILDELDRQRAATGREPCIGVWENVPGVLSQTDNAFGCFLSALAGDDEPMEPGERPEHGKSGQYWTWKKPKGEAEKRHVPKWPVAGVIVGPERTVGWIVRDAQYHGLAQRRRRVFVVASARAGFDPAAILLEFDRVRRDSAPSRETGEGVAGTLDARATGGGFPGTDGACSGYVVPAATGDRSTRTVGALDTECGFSKATMQSVHAGHVMPCVDITRTGDPSPTWWDGSPVSQTLDAVLHKGQTMPEKNRFPAVLQPVTGFSSKDYGALAADTGAQQQCSIAAAPLEAHPPAICVTGSVTHTLRAEGFDATEDGTGRGQPITVCHGTQDPCIGGENDVLAETSWDAQEKRIHDMRRAVAPTIASRCSGGGTVDGWYYNPTTMAVRRLMPVECERLQGFPDNWTRIPVRRYKERKITKTRPEHLWEPDPDGVHWWLMAADGPRYKQLGNSMAVPVMQWLGARILWWLRYGDAMRNLVG